MLSIVSQKTLGGSQWVFKPYLLVTISFSSAEETVPRLTTSASLTRIGKYDAAGVYSSYIPCYTSEYPTFDRAPRDSMALAGC